MTTSSSNLAQSIDWTIEARQYPIPGFGISLFYGHSFIALVDHQKNIVEEIHGTNRDREKFMPAPDNYLVVKKFSPGGYFSGKPLVPDNPVLARGPRTQMEQEFIRIHSYLEQILGQRQDSNGKLISNYHYIPATDLIDPTQVQDYTSTTTDRSPRNSNSVFTTALEALGVAPTPGREGPRFAPGYGTPLTRLPPLQIHAPGTFEHFPRDGDVSPPPGVPTQPPPSAPSGAPATPPTANPPGNQQGSPPPPASQNSVRSPTPPPSPPAGTGRQGTQRPARGKAGTKKGGVSFIPSPPSPPTPPTPPVLPAGAEAVEAVEAGKPMMAAARPLAGGTAALEPAAPTEAASAPHPVLLAAAVAGGASPVEAREALDLFAREQPDLLTQFVAIANYRPEEVQPEHIAPLLDYAAARLAPQETAPAPAPTPEVESGETAAGLGLVEAWVQVGDFVMAAFANAIEAITKAGSAPNLEVGLQQIKAVVGQYSARATGSRALYMYKCNYIDAVT